MKRTRSPSETVNVAELLPPSSRRSTGCAGIPRPALQQQMRPGRSSEDGEAGRNQTGARGACASRHAARVRLDYPHKIAVSFALRHAIPSRTTPSSVSEVVLEDHRVLAVTTLDARAPPRPARFASGRGFRAEGAAKNARVESRGAQPVNGTILADQRCRLCITIIA